MTNVHTIPTHRRAAIAGALLAVCLSARPAAAQLLSASGDAFATVRPQIADTPIDVRQQSASYPTAESSTEAVADARRRVLDFDGRVSSDATCIVAVDQPLPLPLGLPADFRVDMSVLTIDEMTDYQLTGRGVQSRTFTLAAGDVIGNPADSGGLEVAGAELRSFLVLSGFMGVIADASGVAPQGLEAKLDVLVSVSSQTVLSGTIRVFGEGTASVATRVTGDLPQEITQTFTRELGDGRRMVLGVMNAVRLPFTYTVVPDTSFSIAVTLTATVATAGGTTGGTVVVGGSPDTFFETIRAVVGPTASQAQLAEAEQALNAALPAGQRTEQPDDAPVDGTQEPTNQSPCALSILGLGLVGLVAWRGTRVDRSRL